MLGFIFFILIKKTEGEGEGSFYISKTNRFSLGFNLGQSVRDLTLMEEIKTYMVNFPGSVNNKDIIYLDIQKARKANTFDMVYIKIFHLDYITKALIPFLDSMKWQSKKELDQALLWRAVQHAATAAAQDI
jgi:hypothetical protein